VPIAACSDGWVICVPELAEPAVVLQPPLVWIAKARPVASSITGEPELPPQVSTVYVAVVPLKDTDGPVWVCCVWLRDPVPLAGVQVQLALLPPALLALVPSRP
jgi:hypothetical protein